MSSVLDIILLLIVAIFAVIGAKKGFVKSVSGFVSYIVSFFLTFAFYKKATVLVKRLPFIAKMITDVEMPEFSDGNNGFMEKIKVIIDYIISSDDVSETANAVAKNLIADVIATVIAFVLVFILALIIMKVIFLIIGVFVKAPIIRQADGILGFVFGILNGFFWAWIIANLFGNLLFPILNSKWPDIFIMPMLDSTIYKLCTKINPMTYIFMAIKKISGN